jgi:hypothetical protein
VSFLFYFYCKHNHAAFNTAHVLTNHWLLFLFSSKVQGFFLQIDFWSEVCKKCQKVLFLSASFAIFISQPLWLSSRFGSNISNLLISLVPYFFLNDIICEVSDVKNAFVSSWNNYWNVKIDSAFLWCLFSLKFIACSNVLYRISLNNVRGH